MFPEPEQLALTLLQGARAIRKRGDVRPMVLVEGEELFICDVANLWTDPDAKSQGMVQLGAALGFGLDARRIYVVSDAWVTKPEVVPGESREASRERAFAGPAPSQSPNRTEALLIHSSTRDGSDHFMTMQQYARRGKRLVFEDPTTSRGDDLEDFTFHLFWRGLEAAEEKATYAAGLVGKQLSDTFEDSGMTAETHARRAARMLAIKLFGAQIYSPPNQADN